MSTNPPWRMNRAGPSRGGRLRPMTATVSRTRQPEVLTPDERAARGKAARKPGPSRSARGVHAAAPTGPTRWRCWRSQATSAGARAGADPVRPDAGLPVHVLPRRGAGHGGRPGRDAGVRPARPALRRRAPVQLRRVRLAGAAAGLRRQRLRRDPARPVGVGRQAAGRQPGGRRPRQRASAARSAAGSCWPGSAAYRKRDAAGSPACSNLDVWYARIDVDDVDAASRGETLTTQAAPKRPRRASAKARTRDSMQAFAKLTELVDGQRRIIADPPLLVPIEDLLPRAAGACDLDAALREADPGLPAHPADRPADPARAVPTSSTWPARSSASAASAPAPGSSCCSAATSGDPLFLQAKEAQPSVLEAYVGASAYANQGQRVVAGQRLMQAASDIFLGWHAGQRARRAVRGTSTSASCATGRARADIEHDGARPAWRPTPRMCGWTLARAHARSGDRIAIAVLPGQQRPSSTRPSPTSPSAYADQNERTSTSSRRPSATGRIKTVRGL